MSAVSSRCWKSPGAGVSSMICRSRRLEVCSEFAQGPQGFQQTRLSQIRDLHGVMLRKDEAVDTVVENFRRCRKLSRDLDRRSPLPGFDRPGLIVTAPCGSGQSSFQRVRKTSRTLVQRLHMRPTNRRSPFFQFRREVQPEPCPSQRGDIRTASFQLLVPIL